MFSHLLFGKDVKIKTQNNIYLNKVMGSSVFVGLLMIALWIWGLVITIKYWNEIPLWAKILAIIGLVTGFGPLLTVIVVYVGRSVNT